jgi:hypothetical protein
MRLMLPVVLVAGGLLALSGPVTYLLGRTGGGRLLVRRLGSLGSLFGRRHG